MKTRFLLSAIAVLSMLCGWYFTVGTGHGEHFGYEKESAARDEGNADDAFEWWYAQRALPFTVIPHNGLVKAYEYTTAVLAKNNRTDSPLGDTTQWESIGPNNIGGRVLSLAIDPTNPNRIWAGSASGGLWNSTTGGKGANAWRYVVTNFPLLSVSTIAINPSNTNEIYVGTGEISGYNLGQVGTPAARSTYGLGILKSTDGGATWDSTGLNWNFSQMRSVQKIAVNPKNPKALYAATSEGTYKSVDAGKTWTLIHSVLMAMDLALNPNDTSEVYVACGQRGTAPNPGLYKTADGGITFKQLTAGLPASSAFGRTSLTISPSNDSVVYASIANAVSHNLEGLFRTTDKGASWTKVSATNYLGSQGWYDNIILVSPVDPKTVYTAGLDVYKSIDGGATLLPKSYWWKGNQGVVPAGGSEGPSDYAHADHHAMAIDPTNPQRIFFGTDGGVFESTDGGTTFAGRNGGFITTQFYNGFANAQTDSTIALGGLQDNGTIKYEGSLPWNKVFGGDGGWCAIDAADKNIMYEEYVYLAIAKTTNGGATWSGILSSNADSSNFIAPFVVSPSNGSVLYAGAKKLYKSMNGGASWKTTKNDSVLNGTNIACIGVSATSADTLIAATGQRATAAFPNPRFEIFRSTNGGAVWSKSASATPQRYPTDIAFDPLKSTVAYCTFSGYGSPHVFKSIDAGTTWSDISANLPDLPVQSITVDPAFPASIYIGTDLGVYRTSNGGASWEDWRSGMPPAMVLDVSVSPVDRRLRAATFGNGVYQRKLPSPQSTGIFAVDRSVPSLFSLVQNYPNPFNPSTNIAYDLPSNTMVTLTVYDVSGKQTAVLVNEKQAAGRYRVQWNGDRFASGIYFYRLQAGGMTQTKKMILLR